MGQDETTRTETLWVLRAQVGDREAFDHLFLWSERFLRPHIRNIVRDTAATEDVLQNVFLTIYRKIRWLQDPELFRPWLYRIATRSAIDYRRKHTAYREEPLDDLTLAARTEINPLRQLMAGEALRNMDGISVESRAILSLHYLEEMSIDEAAAVLGIPVGTAKSRLARGIQSLKSLLRRKSGKGALK